MKAFARIWMFSLLVVAACAPVPKPPRAFGPPLAATGPVDLVGPVDLTPGFNEKEPDTCKSAGLQSLVGQPSGMTRTVPVNGTVRLIGPGELVSQEYDPHRVDVFTDANGIILRISCG